MDTEIKWAMIAMLCVIGLPMAGMALNDYQKNACRIEAIKAQVPADSIVKICGK
jgi:hypothetical protein